MDTDVIQKLADFLGTTVDSIWQMKPAIVQQHICNSTGYIIIGLSLLIAAFFVFRKYYDYDPYINDNVCAAIAVFCALGFVLFMCGMISFANWMTAPDVCFIKYIMDLIG